MDSNINSTVDARQTVEDKLNDLLQQLFELSVVVYDFQPDGNKLVWTKINNILEHYRELDDLKNNLDSFVPEEVINYIEQGRNPDLFTQAFVERTATENQFTNGKIKAVSEFRTLLSEEFNKSFPDLYDNNLNHMFKEVSEQSSQSIEPSADTTAETSTSSSSA